MPAGEDAFGSAAQEKFFPDLVQDGHLLLAGDHRVYSGRIDVCVAQEVGQPYDILFPFVIADCEQVPEVVGKDLAAQDVRFL